MERKVIQLPKVHTWRKLVANRFHERKASVALSLGAILVLSILVNQWLISPDSMMANADTNRRGIASVNLTLEDYRKQLQWEHALAEEMAKNKSPMAHFSERPNLRDQLLFGHLGGRYGVKMENGRVAGFDFNSEKALGSPVKISDYERFIEEYRGVWNADFAEVRFQQQSNTKVIYELLGADSTKVGQAELDLDQDGRLLNFRILK